MDPLKKGVIRNRITPFNKFKCMFFIPFFLFQGTRPLWKHP